MLPRSRTLTFRSGGEAETPLLIPSISSKGFAPTVLDGEKIPAAAFYLEAFAGWMTESLLVSAYDIHHRLIADVDGLYDNFPISLYSQPKLLVVDSGLYEFRPGSDAGVLYADTEQPLEWNPDLLANTLDRLPAEVSAAIVNWDTYDSYDAQIVAAEEFFAVSERLRFISIFLVKPEPDYVFHDFTRLAPYAERLRVFDVVGVTEKELGDTILGRLRALSKLRSMLEGADVHAPIHVFGGLDPLYTPLYFAAGAEIFDGLSWLRYAYHDGVSIYPEAALVIDGMLAERLGRALALLQIRNLQVLQDLQRDLKILENTHKWSHFKQRQVLEAAARVLETPEVEEETP